MAWKPSTDPTNRVALHTPFWDALETVYNKAFPRDPLPRLDKALKLHYITERQGYGSFSQEALLSRIPRRFRRFPLGKAEIECLDFLLNYKADRILSIVGARGAGKTSFIHYLEYLLDQRRTPTTPNLIIINGNREVKPGVKEFTAQIAQEISALAERHRARHWDSPITLAMTIGKGILEPPEDCTRAMLIDAFQQMKSLLPNEDPRMLVLVFDNLDPLPVDSIDIAFHLARDIHQALGIGSILCMRPSLFRKLGDRGGARQFVKSYIRIHPPKLCAWLARFPTTMNDAIREARKDGLVSHAHGKCLTPLILDQGCRRFVSLFEDRPLDDDPTVFLESVCAQDMRHLRNLMHRILENASLPSAWLLGNEAASEVKFHPLSAAMEGPNRCYHRNADIANVLCFEKDGEVHCLIMHRLLNVLSDLEPRKTPKVLDWMRAYGYDNELTLEALEVLRICNLVYGSDLDVKWSVTQQPEYCGLTAGGKYFLQHLLENPDYLTAAVLDVPLEHRVLKRTHVDSFAARMHSLAEYLAEVCQHENWQISQMRRQNPNQALLIAADRLRHGGSLTKRIITGLEKAVKRVQHSPHRAVQAAHTELTPIIDDYRRKADNIEKALWEVRNKAAKHVNIPQVLPVDTCDPRSHIKVHVAFTPVGGLLEGAITLETPHAQASPSLIVIMDPNREPKLVDIVCLQKADAIRTLVGTFLWLPSSEKEKPALQLRTLSLNSEGSSVAILTTVRDPVKGASLVLIVLRSGLPERLHLGHIPDCSELHTWSKSKLAEVSQCLLLGQPIDRKIRAIGANLAERVLDEKGRERLLSAYDEVKRCLISSDLRAVPWEWIIPGESAIGVAISEQWDTLRGTTMSATTPT